MRLRIEKLRKKDLPDFYKLFKKALFEDFKEYSPEVAVFQWKRIRYGNLLKLVKSGEEYIFVTKTKAKRVVGILASGKIIGGVANCDWLIVSKEFRGQGIGSRLMTFWGKWVKKNKGHMLTLSCDQINLRFYKKLGFTKYGYMEKGYFNENDYLLGKKIGVWNKRSLNA